MSEKLTEEPFGTEDTLLRKRTKYQCPSDFISCSYEPCATSRRQHLGSSVEIWLIKAPLSFSPDSFSGVRIPLTGFKTVQARVGTQKTENYSILSNPTEPESMHLVSDCNRKGRMVCGPALSGLINICENAGDSLASPTPMPLPACPAPCVPEGLKQRFTPFGSRSCPSTERSKRKRASSHTEGRKRSKKDKGKKMDMKVEEVEKEIMEGVGHVAVHQSRHSEEDEKVKLKKGKKKKKKNTQTVGQSQSSLNIKDEIEVKIEP